MRMLKATSLSSSLFHGASPPLNSFQFSFDINSRTRPALHNQLPTLPNMPSRSYKAGRLADAIPALAVVRTAAACQRPRGLKDLPGVPVEW